MLLLCAFAFRDIYRASDEFDNLARLIENRTAGRFDIFYCAIGHDDPEMDCVIGLFGERVTLTLAECLYVVRMDALCKFLLRRNTLLWIESKDLEKFF